MSLAFASNGCETTVVLKREETMKLEILNNLDNALLIGDNFSTSLEVALQNNPTLVNDYYTAISDLCSILKTDFSMVLNMSIPVENGGDND